MKIAVVGSGISGLSAAYYLSKKHKVDLFEKENQYGGHANTLRVKYDTSKEIEVDIGFMVFNQQTYPNLINFFLENKIKIEKPSINNALFISSFHASAASTKKITAIIRYPYCKNFQKLFIFHFHLLVNYPWFFLQRTYLNFP